MRLSFGAVIEAGRAIQFPPAGYDGENQKRRAELHDA